MFLPENNLYTKGQCLMQKIIPCNCPKCNNNQNFHKFGKDKFGNQKYRCLVCRHQFALGFAPKTRMKKYPPCPVCGKSSFLHHDYRDYSNFRCSDKKCNHSFFTPKATAALPPSVSKLFGKTDLKRMRHSIHLIISVLTLFFIGKNSTRNISLMLYQLYNIKVSHVTIADWCKKFAPIFDSISLKLIPTMDFNSDEWHADETVVKIAGKKYYIWFIIDSETRFVLGFHLSPYRSSPQAHSLFNHVAHMGNPSAIVSDRYSAYNIPAKCYFPTAKHIRVESFKDDISNNLIEAFNNRFKAWYKTKRGFNSFASANATISVFVFFFNFIRPHSGLDNLTPAQVAGCDYKPNMKNLFSLAN
jgi:transposase-like protein